MKNKHYTDKDLLSFESGSLSSKNMAAISEHLKICSICSNKYNTLQKIVSPYYSETITPADNLKDKVLSSYRNIYDEKKSSLLKTNFWYSMVRQYRWVIAAVTCIVISISIIFMISQIKHDNPAFTLSAYKGTIFLNGNRIDNKIDLSQGSTISTDKVSYAKLLFDNKLILLLDSNTSIKIKKIAYFNNIPQCTLYLDQGALYSISDNNKNINYKYQTSILEIVPVGTEILLKHKDNESTVMINSGSVIINWFKDKKEYIAGKGDIYTVKNNIIKNKMTPFDKKKFMHMAELFHEKIHDPQSNSSNQSLSNIKKTKHDKKSHQKTDNKSERAKNEIKKEIRSEKDGFKDIKKELRQSRKGLKGNKNK